jgi:hypothetical protein
MIGAVVVAWVVVIALLLALPALAWFIGGRRSWNRLTPKAEPDRYRELVRRHGLRPAEAAEVEDAVSWGRELQDPRLRAAVVDWVRSSRPTPARRPPTPRQRRLAVAALAVVLLAAGVGVHALAGWDAVVMLGIALVTGEVTDRVLGRGPAQALRRNGGVDQPSVTDSSG